MEKRTLDHQAIIAAEYARKNHDVKTGARMAAIGLGIISVPLTEHEVTQLVEDPQQLRILAGLARIHVDSLKTGANQARNPRTALPPLEQANWTINTVYRHQSVIDRLAGITDEYFGNPHDFSAEMPRDVAKTLTAASFLYPPREAQILIESGERLLAATYERLPDDHPTKPLICIELQLSKANSGYSLEPGRLQTDFEQLVTNDLETNPHRAATIASWMMVWGNRLRLPSIAESGSKVFSQITDQHPEWSFMTDFASTQINRQNFRRRVFRILTPFTTFGHRRNKLYHDLLME